MLLALCAAVCAQDEPRRLLASEAVPAEGASARAFVPRGWTLESEVSGDLNGDGLPDAALRLVEDRPRENAEGVPNERARALVIIFARPEGGFRRAAVAARLLSCTTCAGVLGDPDGRNITLEIKKGVLNVSQLSGSREMTELTQRFRYDAASRRFLLIGEDVTTTDRLNGNSTRESSNYLTGVKLTQTYRSRKPDADPVLVSTRTSRLVVRRRFIEEIDYNESL